MYIHLGRDYIVNTRDIIGIFDLENTSVSRRTRLFLANIQQNGATVDLSDDLPRSFVLTDAPFDTIYLSELSTAALRRRVGRTPR